MNPDDDCVPAHVAAGWVLRTLSSDEAECFARHLADCASCQPEVATARGSAAPTLPEVVIVDLPAAGG